MSPATLNRASGAWLLVTLSTAVGAGCDGGQTAPPSPQPTQVQCAEDTECEPGSICTLTTCVPGCRADDDRCPAGQSCRDGGCYPDGEGDAGAHVCPDDMVAVANAFCMDRYEASRPDATYTSKGGDESRATSREGVLPWFPVTKTTAAAACAAAGKRLCTSQEFVASCSGTSGTVYPYGASYDPVICNGIDTYCACGPGTLCEGISPCPYAHCAKSPPAGQSVPASGCGSAMQVAPTGSFPECVSTWGAWDISGNVWELIDNGSPNAEFRGGAYNCIDSEKLHRCDYVATNILARGFRCCK